LLNNLETASNHIHQLTQKSAGESPEVLGRKGTVLSEKERFPLLSWGHQKCRTMPCPCHGDARNAEQYHAHGRGDIRNDKQYLAHAVRTLETGNIYLPKALEDIVNK